MKQQQLTARLQSKGDMRWEPLYDTVTIPVGALTNAKHNFFSTPISGSKGYSKTNLVTAGTLPTPQAQVVYGIKMIAYVTDLADSALLSKLAMDSTVRFFVGTKDYFWQPLAEIIGGITIVSDGLNSVAGSPLALTQLQSPNDKARKLPKGFPVKINSNESFGVEWIINTNHTLNTAVDFRLYLEGQRIVDVR